MEVAGLILGWLLSRSWGLPEQFSAMTWILRPAFFIVALVITLEWLWPLERRRFRRDNLTTVAYFVFGAKIAVFSLVVAPWMQTLWNDLHLPSLHLRHSLHPVLYTLTGFVVITFGDYWAHRWLHAVPELWHIHKIHHAPMALHWATRYHVHFAMDIVHVPLVGVLELLLGTQLLAPFGTLLILIDFFAHANIRLKFGWLNYLVVTPETHRYHHSQLPQHFNCNYSNAVPFWDMLFGTFHYDPKQPATTFGLPEVPDGFIRQQWLPFPEIAVSLHERLVARRKSPYLVQTPHYSSEAASEASTVDARSA